MSSPAPSFTSPISSRIDEQLRLRIAEDLSGKFKGDTIGPDHADGVSVYEPEQAAAALRSYANVVPTLPRTVGWHAALKHDMPVLPFVPPSCVGKRLLMPVSMWLDDAEDPVGAEMIGRLPWLRASLAYAAYPVALSTTIRTTTRTAPGRSSPGSLPSYFHDSRVSTLRPTSGVIDTRPRNST